MSKEIERNRGLTPHRNKENKNPRKKHRRKFEKKSTALRTSVAGRQKRTDAGAYGGEATGIRTDMARSVKLK